MSTTTAPADYGADSVPRRRFDHWPIWLIIGLPLSGVLASSITAWLAVTGLDPQIDAARERYQPNQAEVPAQRARNSASSDAAAADERPR